jgi:hypothetical protein
LVVKKGSKSLSRFSAGMPGPLSRNSMIASLPSTRPAISSRRSRAFSVASAAFCTKFIATCCNWPGEPSTSIGPARLRLTSNWLAVALLTHCTARSMTSTRSKARRSSRSVAEKRLSASTMSRVRSAPSTVPSISEGRSSSRRSMRNSLRRASRSALGMSPWIAAT